MGERAGPRDLRGKRRVQRSWGGNLLGKMGARETEGRLGWASAGPRGAAAGSGWSDSAAFQSLAAT